MSWKVLITARTMNEVGASALQLLRDAGCDVVTPPKPGPLSADEPWMGLVKKRQELLAVFNEVDKFTVSFKFRYERLRDGRSGWK